MTQSKFPQTIDGWQSFITEWRKRKGFVTNWENMPVKTMLIITELGRAVDAHRKDNRKLMEHELTDGLIRFLDLLSALNVDTQKWLERQMRNNERRVYKHGKKY